MYKTHNNDTGKVLEWGLDMGEKKSAGVFVVGPMWLSQLCACVHQPSQDENSIRRNRSTFCRCTWRTLGALTPTRIPIKKTKRSPQLRRQLASSRGSRMDNLLNWWRLDSDQAVQKEKKKKEETVAESCGFENTVSSPPAAAKANCSLLWMFGSNQSLPNTLSLQPLTYFYLPRAATCHHLLPQLPSPHIHTSTISLTNVGFGQWSFFVFYFLHCFYLHVMLPLHCT